MSNYVLSEENIGYSSCWSTWPDVMGCLLQYSKVNGFKIALFYPLPKNLNNSVSHYSSSNFLFTSLQFSHPMRILRRKQSSRSLRTSIRTSSWTRVWSMLKTASDQYLLKTGNVCLKTRYDLTISTTTLSQYAAWSATYNTLSPVVAVLYSLLAVSNEFHHCFVSKYCLDPSRNQLYFFIIYNLS